MIIDSIGSLYSSFHSVAGTLLWIFSALTAYRIVYLLIGVFFTRKFKHTDNYHKYAILIPARNEEPVLGNLPQQKQDYFKPYYCICGGGHCTDNTAKIAREEGAVHERFDKPDAPRAMLFSFYLKT